MRGCPLPQFFICRFLIMCMSSMPERRMRAQRKSLKPSIGLVRCLMARWSCSTMLFGYLTWRTTIRFPRRDQDFCVIRAG